MKRVIQKITLFLFHIPNLPSTGKVSKMACSSAVVFLLKRKASWEEVIFKDKIFQLSNLSLWKSIFEDEMYKLLILSLFGGGIKDEIDNVEYFIPTKSRF